jgi:plastocyanin
VLTDRVSIVEPAGRPDAWGYAPRDIRVASGTTVVWHNGGVEFHTVTSDDPGRPFDIALEVGKDGSVTFSRAGTFAYHCGVHPQMKGVVHVCDGACR